MNRDRDGYRESLGPETLLSFPNQALQSWLLLMHVATILSTKEGWLTL